MPNPLGNNHKSEKNPAMFILSVDHFMRTFTHPALFAHLIQSVYWPQFSRDVGGSTKSGKESHPFQGNYFWSQSCA